MHAGAARLTTSPRVAFYLLLREADECPVMPERANYERRDEADVQGRQLQAEPAGPVRHARNMCGVVRRLRECRTQRVIPWRRLAATPPADVPSSVRCARAGTKPSSRRVGFAWPEFPSARNPSLPRLARGKENRNADRPTFKNTLGMEFVLVPKGKSWLGGGGGKPGDKEVEIQGGLLPGQVRGDAGGVGEGHGDESERLLTHRRQGAVKDIAEADLKRFPVEQVSWEDARQFVKRLNEQDEGSGLGVPLADGGGMGVRLPRRADGGQVRERASTSTSRSRRIKLLPEQANFEHEQGLEADVQGGLVQAESAGLVRHARQRLGVVRRCRRKPPTGPRGGWSGAAAGHHTPSAAGRRIRTTAPPSDRANDLGLRVARVPVGKEPVALQPPPRRNRAHCRRRSRTASAWSSSWSPRASRGSAAAAASRATRKSRFKDDFYLGEYEVTQEEWEKVMGKNPSHFSRTGGGKDAVKDISDADLKRFPVENVSWNDTPGLPASG